MMLPKLHLAGGRALLRPSPWLRAWKQCSNKNVVRSIAISEASTAAPVEGPAFKANLDFKYVRDNLQAVVDNCRVRNSTANPQLVAELYDEYLGIKQQAEALRASRNENSQAMKVRKLAFCSQCGPACACPGPRCTRPSQQPHVCGACTCPVALPNPTLTGQAGA
jgi:hypothetical protein